MENFPPQSPPESSSFVPLSSTDSESCAENSPLSSNTQTRAGAFHFHMACRRSRGGGLSTGLHNFADQAARLQLAPRWRLAERQPVIQAARTQARKINCFSLSARSVARLTRTLRSWEMKNPAFGIEVADEIRRWPCTQRVSGLEVKSSGRCQRPDKRTAPSLQQERESAAETH